jgi:hypothetical protein
MSTDEQELTWKIDNVELAPVSLDTTLFNGTEKERGS